MMSPQTSAVSDPQAHLHIAGELCPWCDQPIPHEKFEEITARIEGNERARAAEAEQRLRESLATERAQIESKAQADLDALRKQSEVAVSELTREARDREVLAREEGRRAAEAAAADARTAEQLRTQQERQALEEKLQTADIAKAALEQERGEMAVQLAMLSESINRRETAAREEGRQAAEAFAAAERTVEQLRAKHEKQVLEEKLQVADAAKTILEQERSEAAAQLAALTESILTRETAAREAGKLAAEVAAVADLESARAAQRLAEAELEALKAGREAELQLRLNEQREALEKQKTDAINSERSLAFDEKLKLEGKLQEVQRQLQNKTAAELGEGAEVDLFDTLKAEFPDDRIRRVTKGVSGADIIHEVMHNGRACGSIIYDSKNCSAWRHDYATKLRQDQLAAGADHAVLATPVFPAGTRQLNIVDGVVLTNPARAAVVAQLLRKQLVQVHSLRLSSDERDQKTTQLYSFITSERCAQLLERMSNATTALEEVDVKELKSHQATWKKRGELIRTVQRHQAEFSFELDRIVGTAEDEKRS
jgi:hypothetical protein